jgi:acyl-CoA thioester hydrolase
MADGRFDGTTFVWPLRVYYEDTDAVGVVYYANYLKFAERARTEMLRALGIEQSGAMKDAGLAFVVKRCEIDYQRPARLDDRLDVTLSVTKVGGASLEGRQAISRAGEDLAQLFLRLGCIDPSGKPAKMPADVRAQLEQLCNE